MSRFSRLGSLDGQTFSITLKTDSDSYLGRECPSTACGRYFKLTPGTGLPDIETCRCPYCGHQDEFSEFTTEAQRDYAISVVEQQVTRAVLDDLRELEFDNKPRGAFGIGISMKVQGNPPPVRWYWELELETAVVCESCSLRYAVYGVFGFCPDCGLHNSLAHLRSNLDIVLRGLELAHGQTTEVIEKLRVQAIGQLVAEFDGFGRATCTAHMHVAIDPNVADRISFQNLAGAHTNIQQAFGLALDSGVEVSDWQSLIRTFQKRHLFAHRAGVVDQTYLDRTGDPRAILGRRVHLDDGEVEATANRLVRLAEHLHASLTAMSKDARP